MLQSLRLWLFSSLLASLLKVPKSLWTGLLEQVRALDAQPLTNDQRQTAAEEWLRDSLRGLTFRLTGLGITFDLLSPAVIRRAVQGAVITVRIEDLLSLPSTTTAS